MILILSVTCYITSVFQIGINTGSIDRDYYGYHLVVAGWTGLFAGQFGLAWLANPIYFFTLLLFFRRKVFNFLLAILLVVLALQFVRFQTVIVTGANESPFTLGLGYYFWLTSFIILAIGAAINYFKPKSKDITD